MLRRELLGSKGIAVMSAVMIASELQGQTDFERRNVEYLKIQTLQ